MVVTHHTSHNGRYPSHSDDHLIVPSLENRFILPAIPRRGTENRWNHSKVTFITTYRRHNDHMLVGPRRWNTGHARTRAQQPRHLSPPPFLAGPPRAARMHNSFPSHHIRPVGIAARLKRGMFACRRGVLRGDAGFKPPMPA